MRKICLLAFSLLIFLLSFNILFTASDAAEAKSNAASAKDLSQEIAASDSAQKVNYELPYPGLLPDNPLYFLRVIRDRIVSFLISDAKKKAEFNLLQADKRLNAGIFLFDLARQNEKKINLAISTTSKAENYFEQALEKTKEARNEGIEIKELTEKLLNSAKKHQEELGVLEEKSQANFKEGFVRERKRAENFEKQARDILPKK